MKHLPLFHQNRDSRSKDENKNEKRISFHFSRNKNYCKQNFSHGKTFI